MLKPYIVSKVVDSSGKTILENKKTELGTVVSTETVDKMKKLMRSVISEQATGAAYMIDGYDFIGKTGTAQIFEKGRYLSGNGEYIYSFAGLYPGDDPEIIIYMAIKKPQDGYNYIADPVKQVVINTSKYMSIENRNKELTGYKVSDYSNKVVTEVTSELKNNGIRVITLGTGNKVIGQYPEKNINIYKNDLVVLLTNKYNKEMIDFTGMSYKETKEILKLMGVEYELSGYGYVTKQNIEKGNKITEKVVLELKGLY